MTTTTGSDQVTNMTEQLLPPAEAQDPLLPRMPFKTSYLLNREQEDALVKFACDRMTQVEDQMGQDGEGNSGVGNEAGNTRDAGTTGGHGGYHEESFWGKREKYTKRYENHVKDRAQADTVYEHSNLTASLSQRITMQMVAKANGFFFGQPDDIDWFSTDAVGSEDEETSDKLKKHSRWKVDQCGIKTRLLDAIERAFIRGEAVVKVTHQKRGQVYKRTATILLQTPGGEAILDAHGDFIVQGDTFVPEMAIPAQEAVASPEVGNYGAAPEQVGSKNEEVGNGTAEIPQAPIEPQPTGQQILKRDGVTVLPAVPFWEERIITRYLVTFEGPEAEVIHFSDFLCPMDATNVQTADLIAHKYDRNVMRVAEMFRGQYGEGDAAIADMKLAVDRLRDLIEGASAQAKAGANAPREDAGEHNTDASKANPICHLAEVFLSYDADGDGIMEEIFLVVDRTKKAPIYYEYLANVTVRGTRPVYVIRPRAADGRWYGMGAMELFDPEQEFIDLQINRHNFSTSKAGRVTLWRPYNTLEGDLDPNLKLRDGMTYTPKQGKEDKDILSYVQLPSDAEQLEYLISLFMQLMQTKAGVINAADQQMSGLPSSKLATGINEIHDSGEELFSHVLAALFPGVKETLRAIIDVIYANMNKVEVFNFFNGEANEVITLSPEDVRDLATNVTLVLSRSQQRKSLETGEQATKMITWFYSLPPDLQERVAHFTQTNLKAMGVSQADKVIEPMPPQNTPVDKPSSIGQMLAALIKAGVPISAEDINALLQQAGMPPLQPGAPPVAVPPPVNEPGVSGQPNAVNTQPAV